MTGKALALFAAIGVVTYALRASFLVGMGGAVTKKLERYLRYVPCAVLPALTVVALRSSAQGGGELVPRLVALLVGGFVAWRTRSPGLTMLVGMVVLWAIGAAR